MDAKASMPPALAPVRTRGLMSPHFEEHWEGEGELVRWAPREPSRLGPRCLLLKLLTPTDPARLLTSGSRDTQPGAGSWWGFLLQAAIRGSRMLCGPAVLPRSPVFLCVSSWAHLPLGSPIHPRGRVPTKLAAGPL